MLFAKSIQKFYNGEIIWGPAQGLIVLLCNNSFVPNEDTHEFLSDIPAGAELSVNGYSRQPLANANSAVMAASKDVVFNADDVSFTNLQAPDIASAIIAKDTGAAATSPLIYLTPSVLTTTATVDPYTVQWDASGIFRVSYGEVQA